jgi:hypothetical protein
MPAHSEYAGVIAIVRLETLIRRYRAGSQACWRRKSRNQGSHPDVVHEPHNLIRRICEDVPLCGAPRIHDELLKLGITVGGTT